MAEPFKRTDPIENALPKRTRPGGRSATVKSALLAAAEEIIADDPFAPISIAALARGARVTYTTVARRWTEIQFEIASARVARLMAAVSNAAGVDGVSGLARWASELAERLKPLAVTELPPCFLPALGTAIQYNLMNYSLRAASSGLRFPNPEVAIDVLVAPIVFHRLTESQRDLDDVIRDGLDRLWM